MKATRARALNSKQRGALLQLLKARFQRYPQRHPGITWDEVEARLLAHPAALRALAAMEDSGGEPDVVGRETESDTLLFFDCSVESPSGRRSLCFDRRALEERKQAPPAGNVIDCAAALGIELLNEDQYRALQLLGPFDTKTSSWIATPAAIRDRGGALFMDRRYEHVFVYHNGASSYYAARGFRGALRVGAPKT